MGVSASYSDRLFSDIWEQPPVPQTGWKCLWRSQQACVVRPEHSFGGPSRLRMVGMDWRSRKMCETVVVSNKMDASHIRHGSEVWIAFQLWWCLRLALFIPSSDWCWMRCIPLFAPCFHVPLMFMSAHTFGPISDSAQILTCLHTRSDNPPTKPR